MTLGRLMELYQAEQQGKQIMKKEYRCFGSYKYIEEIKLSECVLSMLVLEDTDDDYSYTYFIKGEEDEYGNKL